MTELIRATIIQELSNLKIELDRGNKFKNENITLIFKVTEDSTGCIKVFATTGIAFKLILEKQSNFRWQIPNSNQFVNLGTWLADFLKHEVSHQKIHRIIQNKIMSLYRY